MSIIEPHFNLLGTGSTYRGKVITERRAKVVILTNLITASSNRTWAMIAMLLSLLLIGELQQNAAGSIMQSISQKEIVIIAEKVKINNKFPIRIQGRDE